MSGVETRQINVLRWWCVGVRSLFVTLSDNGLVIVGFVQNIISRSARGLAASDCSVKSRSESYTSLVFCTDRTLYLSQSAIVWGWFGFTGTISTLLQILPEPFHLGFRITAFLAWRLRQSLILNTTRPTLPIVVLHNRFELFTVLVWTGSRCPPSNICPYRSHNTGLCSTPYRQSLDAARLASSSRLVPSPQSLNHQLLIAFSLALSVSGSYLSSRLSGLASMRYTLLKIHIRLCSVSVWAG